MKQLCIVLLISFLVSTALGVGTFGRFPLGTNVMAIRVGDWQCAYSGYVERSLSADVVPVPIAFPATVFTGMYVSGVTTGDIPTITTNIPPTTNHVYYYTTNWSFGDVSVTLTNWSGTNIVGVGYTARTEYVWSGPMKSSVQDSWDAAFKALVTNYLDLDGMEATNWWTTKIGEVTNVRNYLTDPCTVGATNRTITTNKVSVYRTAPLLWSVSNLWARAKIGTDFNYSTGTNYWEQIHSYQFTLQPTSSVVVPLGVFICKATNMFYTTNVTVGPPRVTNVVANYGLVFGGDTYFGTSNLLHTFPDIPYANLNYKDRTNSASFFRVRSPNTNLSESALNSRLTDMKVTLIGKYCAFITNGHLGPYTGTSTTLVSGVANDKHIANSLYGIIDADWMSWDVDAWWAAYDACAGDPVCEEATWNVGIPMSTSTWSRTETNGQWDTLIGTTVEICWSNTTAFYGATAGWGISAQGLNERYMVLTSLVATTRSTVYSSYDPNKVAYWVANSNTWRASGAGACHTVPVPYSLESWMLLSAFSVPSVSLTTGAETWFASPVMSGELWAEIDGWYECFGPECESGEIKPAYAYTARGSVDDFRAGKFAFRLMNVKTNVTPISLSRMRIFSRVEKYYDYYKDFFDPIPPADYLQVTEVADQSAEVVPIVLIRGATTNVLQTNWYYTASSVVTFQDFGLLGSGWWNFEKTAPAGTCPTRALYDGGNDTWSYESISNVPSCVVGSMSNAYRVSRYKWNPPAVDLIQNAVTYLYWDFQYK